MAQYFIFSVFENVAQYFSLQYLGSESSSYSNRACVVVVTRLELHNPLTA